MPALKSATLDVVDLVDGCHVQLDVTLSTRREAEAFATPLHQAVLDIIRGQGGVVLRNEAERRQIILPG